MIDQTARFNPECNPVTLLKASDVARRLNISKSLAYQLMQRGTIPTIRIGRSVRVRPNDLDEFITLHWTGWDDQLMIS